MNTKKLVTTALIIAMGVVSNSLFVIPIGLAKVAPMQSFSLGKRRKKRDGWLMSGLTPLIFSKLKAKKAIKSEGGKPYRITRRGLELVRAQVDNR